jgi:hypothetical protein
MKTKPNAMQTKYFLIDFLSLTSFVKNFRLWNTGFRKVQKEKMATVWPINCVVSNTYISFLLHLVYLVIHHSFLSFVRSLLFIYLLLPFLWIFNFKVMKFRNLGGKLTLFIHSRRQYTEKNIEYLHVHSIFSDLFLNTLDVVLTEWASRFLPSSSFILHILSWLPSSVFPLSSVPPLKLLIKLVYKLAEGGWKQGWKWLHGSQILVNSSTWHPSSMCHMHHTTPYQYHKSVSLITKLSFLASP